MTQDVANMVAGAQKAAGVSASQSGADPLGFSSHHNSVPRKEEATVVWRKMPG